jgi:hypothetical protein
MWQTCLALGCLRLSSWGDVFDDLPDANLPSTCDHCVARVREFNPRYAEGALLCKFSHFQIDIHGNWDFRFPPFVLC